MRFSALAREMAFAATFGASFQADALQAALRVPNLFRDLFAEGSMSHALVPALARAEHAGGEAEMWRLSNAVLGPLLLGLGVLTFGMFVGAEPAVEMVAAAFSPEKAALTATLVRWVSPFLLAIALASFAGSLLQVRGRLFVSGLAPGILNIAVVLGSLAAIPLAALFRLEPIVVVALATVVGAFGAGAVQLPGLWREGWRPAPTLKPHPERARVLRFLVPALLGLATVQVGVLLDVQLAARLGDGPVSQLAYAFRVVQLPMSLFGGAIAMATLAPLASQTVRGDMTTARITTGRAIGLTAFWVVPCAVGLAVWADPVVSLLFERGQFTAADTAATAAIVRAYALGTLAFSLHRVVVPMFFAWGDAWTPMLLSMAAVFARVPLAFGLVAGLGAPGIALSHAIAAAVEVLLLLLALDYRSGALRWAFWRDVGTTTVATGVMGAVAWSWPSGGIALSAVGGVVATASYAASAALLGTTHLRGFGANGLPPHLDPSTIAALEAHRGALVTAVVPVEGTYVVTTTTGTLTVRVCAGLLSAQHSPTPSEGQGAPLRWQGVLDLSQRPPPLHGLILTWGNRRVSLGMGPEGIIERDVPGPIVEPT